MTNELRRRRPHRSKDDDVALGARLRARRIAFGKTQKDVAEWLDVSFQQIQKYENGSVRIPAMTLYRMCAFLEISVERMFEGLDPRGLDHA